MKKDKNSKILRNKVSARAIRRLSGGRGVKGGGDINLCLLGREDCTTQLPIFPATSAIQRGSGPGKNVKYLSLGMENVCDVMRGYLRTSPAEA